MPIGARAGRRTRRVARPRAMRRTDASATESAAAAVHGPQLLLAAPSRSQPLLAAQPRDGVGRLLLRYAATRAHISDAVAKLAQFLGELN